MILINNKNVISISVAKVYENCIKNYTDEHMSTMNTLMSWLPNISTIDISNDETTIRFKDEKEEINLGFTGCEWIFNDYINTFYKEDDDI